MGHDFLAPRDKGRDMLFLSQDKGTTRQAQNLATGLVLLSLCYGTMKKLLSLCPEKLHCPVPLEILV